VRRADLERSNWVITIPNEIASRLAASDASVGSQLG
jgi:hypothetical protein